MEFEEIKETASKQDVEEIYCWLRETEGLVGVERVAQSIRNCYSEIEQQFGPGKEKTYVAQIMQNISRERRNSMNRTLGFTVGMLVIAGLWVVEFSAHPDHPFWMSGWHTEFRYALLGSILFGATLSGFALLLIGGISGILGLKQKDNKAEALLIKYYTRCAELEEKLDLISNKKNPTEGEDNGQ